MFALSVNPYSDLPDYIQEVIAALPSDAYAQIAAIVCGPEYVGPWHTGETLGDFSRRNGVFYCPPQPTLPSS